MLFIADEIQSGLGRTGPTLALDHEGVRADLYTLGKALGGGIMPVSAVVGRRDVLGVLQPGQHGSTFGGNPLACAVGRAVIALLGTGEMQARSTELGAHLHARLGALVGNGAGRGARPRAVGRRRTGAADRARAGRSARNWRGAESWSRRPTRRRCGSPRRMVITRDEIDHAVDTLAAVLAER